MHHARPRLLVETQLLSEQHRAHRVADPKQDCPNSALLSLLGTLYAWRVHGLLVRLVAWGPPAPPT